MPSEAITAQHQSFTANGEKSAQLFQNCKMAPIILMDEITLLLILFLRRQRIRRRVARRTTWTRTRIQRRRGQGVYANLLWELNSEDLEMFRRYHLLDIDSFKTVLDMVGPLIQKQDTNMRPSISSGERLAATLPFLATGMYFFWTAN